MGMINIGAGLSALGNSVAETAGHMALETQKSNMEEQKLRLADQLAGERAWKAPGVAEDIEGKQLGLQQRKNAISSFQALMGGSPASSATDDASSSSTSSPSVKPTGGDTPALPKGVNALPDGLKAQMAHAFALSGGDPTEPLKIYGKWVEEQNKVFDQRKDNRLITGGGELVGSANLQDNPNQPFNSDGTPNQAFQEWELKKQVAGKTTPPAEGAKWEILTDPKNNQQYRYDPVSAKATTLAGESYTPGGAQKIGGGSARSAQAMAVQRFLQDNPGASAEDIAHFSGMYQKTVNQLGGETKADVAALTQITKLGVVASSQEDALSGAISQINSLMNKGAGTSIGPIVNRWLQAGKKATGDKDVAAFNTAVETAANEYAKIITGSTAATDASRAEAASMLDKFQNPDAITAQIGVIQKDAHYKIQSYADHSDFIKQKLNDGGQSGASIPEAPKPPAPSNIIHYDTQGNRIP